MNLKRTLLSITSTVTLAGISHAAVVLQESFDYAADATINTQNGGTGFAGAWSGTNTGGTNPYTVEDGLTFTGLTTSGGSAGRTSRDGRHVITRTVSAASQTALTADNSTVYFSLLMDPRNDDLPGNAPFENNTRGTFVFGNSALADASGATPGFFSAASSGVGVAFNGSGGNTPNNTTFDSSNLVGVSYNVTTTATVTGGTGSVGDVASMIVGEITWAPNGSNDIISLYNVIDPTAGLPATAFATISVDLDQSGFNTISYAEGQSSAIDEIVFGTELVDVGVIPEPSSAALFGFAGLSLLLRRRR